ncbi:MAG: hypothetical protein ACPG4N_02115 [Gammaproteobacteria bacterium]
MKTSADNWLKPLLDKRGYKELLGPLGVSSADTIGRWATFKEPMDRSYFDKLAEVIGHWDADSLYCHYRERYAQARPEDFVAVPVDQTALNEALLAIDSDRFFGILSSRLRVAGNDAIPSHLSALIENGELNQLKAALNVAIDQFCRESSADDINSLQAMRAFCRFVPVLNAKPTVDNTEHHASASYPVHGTEHNYALVFAYDRSRDFDGRRRLKIDDGDISDSTDSTGVISLSDHGADDEHEWAYRVAREIAEVIVIQQSCPDYPDAWVNASAAKGDEAWEFDKKGNSASFERFLIALNDALNTRNDGPNYFLARTDAEIPPGVIARLRRWLGSLLVYDYGEVELGKDCNIMNDRPGFWGSWLAEKEQLIVSTIRKHNGFAPPSLLSPGERPFEKGRDDVEATTEPSTEPSANDESSPVEPSASADSKKGWGERAKGLFSAVPGFAKQMDETSKHLESTAKRFMGVKKSLEDDE